jgi:hypothetical protein
MRPEFIEHPIFICGHPKAGTSLVTALLDGHLAIVAYPEETMFFRRYLPAIEGKSEDEKLALADQLLIHIFEWNQDSPPEHQQNYPDRDYSDIDFEAIRKAFHEEIAQSSGKSEDYLNAAILSFGKVSGLLTHKSQLWVEKTPYNEFYADQIFDWWPAAKCIHIVRDPRDNYVSYQRKQPDWTAKVFAWSWVRSTRAGLENQKKFSKDRYLLLRFEDLLNDPEKVTHQVADFLGIPWHKVLLMPTRAGDSWRGNSMFENKFQTISTDPIGRWKDLISSFNLAMVQAIAGKTMHEMAYELAIVDKGQLNISERIKLLRDQVAARLKGY